MKNEAFTPYIPIALSKEESATQSKQFLDDMLLRRSVRVFSDAPVDQSIIENIIRTAGSAPSGRFDQFIM